MNVLVVDSSSWISFFRGDASPELELSLKEGRAYLPPVVLAELASARMKPNDRAGLMEFLDELPLCETSREHWARVGLLRAEAATQGVNLSTPDAHVAQCALDLDGYLLTEDAIFEKLSRIVPLKRPRLLG